MATFVKRFWKQVFVFLIFFSAFFSFLVSDFIKDTGVNMIFKAFYYAVSLFILGGIDIGFPQNIHTIANMVLWICYFLAPLLTASFVYSFVQEKLLNKIIPRFKNHTVICGLGRNGKLIFDLVNELYPKRHKIVVIESNKDNPYSAFIEKDPTVWWIRGDFTDELALRKARVHRAQQIIISTNEDFSNLKTVFALKSMLEHKTLPKLYCHIGDPGLHRTFNQTIFDQELSRLVEFFNVYDVVTGRLYETWLKPDTSRDNGNIYILVGLGHFGRMLFQNIIADQTLTKNDELLIVSLKKVYDVKLLSYKEHHDMNHKIVIHDPIIDDFQNPAVWERLNEILTDSKKQVYVILCRDNDIANLETSITIKTAHSSALQQATIICRIYSKTVNEMSDVIEYKITKEKERDILLFPFQDELKGAFQEKIFK